MKRRALILCIAFCAFLQACGSSIQEPPASTSAETQAEPIALFGTVEFDDAIRDNPIDKAFEAVEFGTSTRDMIGIHNQFRSYWEAEIDATCEKLYGLLREEDAEILRNAQRAWAEYMAVNHDLRISLFYEDFMSNQPYGVANGTLDKVMMNTVRMEETRRRALELMEYYYRLTGKVRFVFEGG